MFSKKKKGDATADSAAAADSATAPTAPSDNAPQEQAQLGGGLASGLGNKLKPSSTSISRLGGRPPSRPSAPEPVAPVASPAAPPPAPSPVAASAPVPSPTSGQANAAASEAEASRSGRMSTMKEMPRISQSGLAIQDAGPDGRAKVKNPYKLSPLFDVLLPVGMAVVLCGGFAYGIKWPKDKHAIYGYSEAEKQTQVKIPALANAQLMEEIKKMEPLKLLEAGDTAGALAAAKAMGSKAAALASEKGMSSTAKTPPPTGKEDKESSKELGEEDKTVRELLVSGMVLSKVGSKQDKDLGLTYMAKAEEIATYSKYVRLLYARELVRAHKDDEAIEQYQKITTLFKDPWAVPHKELGLLYMRANRGAEAVQELTDLLKTDPSDPSIQRQLGLAMAQNGDQQAGFDEFQKGFTREQDVLSYPAAVKGLVDAHGGLVDATLADVKKQAEKSPQDIKVQLDLARLLIATGKFKEARDIMEKARKTQELNPEVHEVMAEVMCRQSQAQSGYDEFRSAAQNLHLQQ